MKSRLVQETSSQQPIWPHPSSLDLEVYIVILDWGDPGLPSPLSLLPLGGWASSSLIRGAKATVHPRQGPALSAVSPASAAKTHMQIVHGTLQRRLQERTLKLGAVTWGVQSLKVPEIHTQLRKDYKSQALASRGESLGK